METDTHPSGEEIREAFGLEAVKVTEAEAAASLAAARAKEAAATLTTGPAAGTPAAPTPPVIKSILDGEREARKAKRLREDRVRMANAIPDAYGVYLEAIRYHPEDRVAPFRSHIKLFLAENMVATSLREGGKKAGRWKGIWYDDHDQARAKALSYLNRMTPGGVGYAIQMRGRPQLIAMTRVDVAAIREGRLPSARYSGFNEITHTEGRMIDEDWRPADMKWVGDGSAGVWTPA